MKAMSIIFIINILGTVCPIEAVCWRFALKLRNKTQASTSASSHQKTTKLMNNLFEEHSYLKPYQTKEHVYGIFAYFSFNKDSFYHYFLSHGFTRNNASLTAEHIPGHRVTETMLVKIVSILSQEFEVIPYKVITEKETEDSPLTSN